MKQESKDGGRWDWLKKELMGIQNNLVCDITLHENTECETNRIFNDSINKIIQTVFEAVLGELKNKIKHTPLSGIKMILWDDIQKLLGGSK